MVEAEKIGNNIIINNKFCFTEDSSAIDPQYITCLLTCGEDMKYGNVDLKVIDYPGEYQQDTMNIYCIMSKDNKLNYVVKSLQVSFALVQDSKVASANAFEGVTDMISLSESVSNQLEKLDLQCNIITL